MRQKHGRFICVQILQTLNILFENIRHETSLCKCSSSCPKREWSSILFVILDYLLSNNHVNNIIVHKFDFSDEEVTAYYISFLKTLSLKLNTHSINFFYNEVRKRDQRTDCWSTTSSSSSSRETTIFHCMLKQSSSSTIQRPWFALPCERWHWTSTKVCLRSDVFTGRTVEIDFRFLLVPDSAMHRFILDRTATEYFSNLVWFIRNHILDFDNLIRNHRE